MIGQAGAGEQLVNGDLMLFQLLDSSENTQGLSDVMRYILWRYSGNDYGITDFNQIESQYMNVQTIGSDYNIHTGKSSSDLVLTKKQLKKAIKSLYKDKQQDNLLSAIDAFEKIQSQYHVNAVFAMAVCTIESGAGTSWAAIDPSTYNWMSLTGTYKGKTYKNPNSSNKRTWRVYPNFSEATMDFADLIANGSYYFKKGNYTVKSIAPTYCNEDWGEKVVSKMTEIYQAAGVDVSSAIGGSILEVAQQIHTYMEQNHYTYCVYGGNSYEECSGGGHSLSNTFEESKTNKHTCCATYVSWVLQEAGYLTRGEHTNSANALRSTLKKKKWKKITSKSDLQPGDVLGYNHHVEIYAGNNTVYNAGCGSAIRGVAPQQGLSMSFVEAYRPPQ